MPTPPMKRKIKKLWLEALRSGEFQQNTGKLTNADRTKHCCLGVLCELGVREGIIPEPHKESDSFGVKNWAYGENLYATSRTRGEVFTLPLEIREWADLEDMNPFVYAPAAVVNKGGAEPANIVLSTLNDSGYVFSEIADIIEEFL
jgi:hypothetical protein